MEAMLEAARTILLLVREGRLGDALPKLPRDKGNSQVARLLT